MSGFLSRGMLAGAVLAACVSAASAATPAGTLMVLQVGALGNNSTASSVTLLEFQAAGLNASSTPFNTIAVPTTGSLALTLPGTSGKHDGMIRLSGDGNYITFGGYRANAGSPNPSLQAASAVNRVIGKYNLTTEVLDTTQAVNDAYNFTTIDAVVTQNGSQYWLGGGLGFTSTTQTTNWDTSGGVRYVANTSTNTTLNIGLTQVTNAALRPDEVRSVFISSGELYMTTPAQNSYHVMGIEGKEQQRGTYQIGFGTPTAPSQVSNPTYTPLLTNVDLSVDPGRQINQDNSGKWAAKTDAFFLDLDPLIPGEDTAYGTGGKQEYEKWSKYYNPNVGAYMWQQVKVWDVSTISGGSPGGVGGDINGIMPIIAADGTTVDIYVTTDSRFYHFVDTGGYVDPGSPPFALSLPYQDFGTYSFISAAPGTQFRGIAAVPEPASLGVLAMGAGALVMRRRRK